MTLGRSDCHVNATQMRTAGISPWPGLSVRSSAICPLPSPIAHFREGSETIRTELTVLETRNYTGANRFASVVGGQPGNEERD